MKINIAVLLIVGILTYALTLYLSDNNIKPNITNVPDKNSTEETITNTQKIPSFDFTDIHGNTKTIGDFEGKIIILNFWASWCAPCIKEFPDLLYTAANNPDDIVLIALSSDLDEGAIDKFITKMKGTTGFENLNFNAKNIFIAHDQDQAVTAGKFGTFKLPETLIIDRNQNLRKKLIGANWEIDDLQSSIDALK
ncbi:MAG: TlpA family protein disulfide reductase [Alphaproteobacteria bacterium]|nr:TlpA family protein disulfide reductase [Alphaproteobacteria bacterium]